MPPGPWQSRRLRISDHDAFVAATALGAGPAVTITVTPKV
jgi:hypothetical protein